jgi:PBP1b-binding outer membrane lipoprotein LpoB
MKYAFAIVLALLVSAVLISGCTTVPTGGQETGEPSGAQMTQSEKESQALAAVEQEMDELIDNMSMEDLENELLNQG